MKKNNRNELTSFMFKGVTTDGGFVFDVDFITEMKTTTFKLTSYINGVMEIAIDCTEKMPVVAKLISNMLARESCFANLDFVILNYRNIHLQIGKNVDRKTITRMMLAAISKEEYKEQDNNITVDTCICQKDVPLRNSDVLYISDLMYLNSFEFEEIYKEQTRNRKYLWFRNYSTRESIIISSIKDGIVTLERPGSGLIVDYVDVLRKAFVPYSNFFGIKALEVEFNDFSIRMDDRNSDRILYLYRISSSMSILLK